MDGGIFGAAVHLFGNGVRAAFAVVSGAGLYPDGPACRAGTPDGVF